MPTSLDYEDESTNNDDCATLDTTIVVTNKDDLRALPATCFNVLGDVEIVGSDLTDLEGLERLRSSRDFQIRDNNQLRSLRGLVRVNVTGHLEILRNEQLESIEGLDETRRPRQVTIVDNPLLRDLDGLSDLDSVGGDGMEITGNPGLTTLKPLDTLRRVEGTLRIEDNGGLNDLLGFERLEQAGDLIIRSNDSLQGINSFGVLRTIAGDLRIENNLVLGNLEGFTATFQSVAGSMAIDNNPSLFDTYALEVLYSVGGSLIVTRNLALSGCRADNLDRYIEEIGGLIDIGDNGTAWDPCD